MLRHELYHIGREMILQLAYKGCTGLRTPEAQGLHCTWPAWLGSLPNRCADMRFDVRMIDTPSL